MNENETPAVNKPSAPVVYISGPLTSGTSGRAFIENVAAALDAGITMLERGAVPLVPHTNILMGLRAPHIEYETWLAQDLALLRRCDALLRLPGESAGADREVGEAHRLGIPVYYSVETLLAGLDTLGHAVVIPASCVPTSEQAVVLQTFAKLLTTVSKDGGRKRAKGLKPPWWQDRHADALYRHLSRWQEGEQTDLDSGAHPLVHAAWRALAIAYIERYGSTPPKES